ncbi:MAG: sigma-54-dependent Fis family transcriptional regulator [Acidobacteriota bacterium]|nr:MAG: sigma-54-dependent Fis family transcriptional regulator [Acidobacteriota bacterium]
MPDRFRTLGMTANKLASLSGVRECGEAVVAGIEESLSPSFVFLAAPREDTAIAEVIASFGLAAADFRRLESRLSKSSLWSMISRPQPLVIDELRTDARLDFLAFSTRAGKLAAVPVIFRGNCAGMLACGLGDKQDANEGIVIETLDAFASLFAHSLRVEHAAGQERLKLAEENRRLKHEMRERFAVETIVGTSAPMRGVLDQIANVARSNISVLLRGEHGTGKDLAAKAIHFSSLRSNRSFVKLDTATTASHNGGRDLLAPADGGTLFIEDIAELPDEMQATLLAIIETPRSVRSELSTERLPNLRVIAATDRDAEDPIETPLLARLSNFTITLPPLRDRGSDVLLLAEYFVSKYQKKLDKNILRISTPAIDMLTAYHFPGNVRELENVIEKAVAVCDGNVIHGRHLPPTLQTAEESGTEANVTLASAIAAFEKDLIQDALKSTRGNIARAAAMLDSTERILGYKIKKYAIDARRFKR